MGVTEPTSIMTVANFKYETTTLRRTFNESIMALFHLGLDPRVPEHALAHPNNLCACPVDTSFIYGDVDWVRALDREGGNQVVAARNNKNCKVYIVSNSNHNLQCDNPSELAEVMI